MEFKGLEIFHRVVKSDLKSKEDCVVAAVHIGLINKGNKCAGLGDDWKESDAAPSELLPEGWNSSQELYTLRYASNSGKKYLVKIVKAGNNLLLNVLNVTQDIAAGLSVITDNYVSDDFGEYTKAYKNLDALGRSFDQEIVKKVAPKSSPPQKPCPTTSSNPEPSGVYVDPDPYIINPGGNPHSSLREPQRTFPAIGGRDLDPLGRDLGGGMLYDPLQRGPPLGIGPGGLPRGAVPPGARFDPFGPPIPGRGPAYPPNPDHLPPPGYDDAFL